MLIVFVLFLCLYCRAKCLRFSYLSYPVDFSPPRLKSSASKASSIVSISTHRFFSLLPPSPLPQLQTPKDLKKKKLIYSSKEKFKRKKKKKGNSIFVPILLCDNQGRTSASYRQQTKSAEKLSRVLGDSGAKLIRAPPHSRDSEVA